MITVMLFILVWILAGCEAHDLHKATKEPEEPVIPIERCMSGGLIMLLAILIGLTATEASEEEDEMY
jgi:hypothetical protein